MSIVKRPNKEEKMDYKVSGYMMRLTPEQLAQLLGIEAPYGIDDISYFEETGNFYIKTRAYIHKDEYEQKKSELAKSHDNTAQFLEEKLGLKNLRYNEYTHIHDGECVTRKE